MEEKELRVGGTSALMVEEKGSRLGSTSALRWRRRSQSLVAPLPSVGGIGVKGG